MDYGTTGHYFPTLLIKDEILFAPLRCKNQAALCEYFENGH